MYRAVLRKFVALAALLATLGLPTIAQANDSLWIASGEVGVGPIEEDVFLHLTPRLSYLRPVPMFLCERDDCQSFFEASFQVPLRLRIVDNEPEQGDLIRREDWHEGADYFRIIRRLEYGSFADPIHLRVGEIGPANLGNATIINGYYNVVTTDHYRLGIQGRLDRPHWGAQVMVNDLTAPNLIALRASARPDVIYDRESNWRRLTAGVSVAADTNAPTLLARGDDDTIQAGPDLRPLVELARPTLIVGADLRWNAYRGDHFALTPYTDINHHFSLGTGLHTGVLVDADIGEELHLSSRLEYRLLGQRYIPDYIDPLYEITRFQHLAYEEPGLAGPKLTAAASMESSTRHGGYGQLQLRYADMLSLSAAYSDATGPTGAALRLRASFEFEDRVQLGLFYYKASPGTQRFTEALRQTVDLDGALLATEARVAVWGPFYAQGQLARQWRLGDDGRFENIHIFNAGAGAGFAF